MSAVKKSEVSTLHKRASYAGLLLITPGNGELPWSPCGSTGGLDKCVALNTSALCLCFKAFREMQRAWRFVCLRVCIVSINCLPCCHFFDSPGDKCRIIVEETCQNNRILNEMIIHLQASSSAGLTINLSRGVHAYFGFRFITIAFYQCLTYTLGSGFCFSPRWTSLTLLVFQTVKHDGL